jgi:cyclohexanecarboxylate-CoA ligase
MHTHNTLDIGTRQVKESYDLSTDDVVFMASPIGHTTVLIVGARLPVMYGMTTVWQEHWNAEAAVELIAREGCTCTVSAAVSPGLCALPTPTSTRSRRSGLRLRGHPSRAS